MKKIRCDHLTTGAVKSCGCSRKKAMSIDKNQKMKRGNTYDLTGEYGIGYTTKGQKFYFDLEDYDKIKDYHWYFNSDGYVRTNIFNSNYNNKQKQISLHRLVLNVLDNNCFEVDHIYHKLNDNRKSQLRLVTNSQNQMNVPKHKNNTSGEKGVYWHKKHSKWQASIHINGVLKHLGLYNNINDAIKARKTAEEKYFGEYSYKENEEINTNRQTN